jgi:ABC-type transporter Mla maintaining outer membrane lipid asymmetry ATPase subunit MlaF
MGFIRNGLYLYKQIHDPQGEKRQYYAKMQEAARKDVERCFGVLQQDGALFRIQVVNGT